MIDKDMIAKLRAASPDMIAKEIVSVQPMPDDAFAKLYEAAMSEEELKAQGYRPVSNLSLMWIKDDDNCRS